MRWMVGLSLRYGLLMAAAAAGVLVLGFTQLRAMPVDMLPEFAPTYVEVQTEALGLSAQEVEQLITVPLEQDLLNGVPWLAEIRSESLPGLSSVVMTFDPGTDALRARQVVGERMTQAFALPHVSRPPTMLQPTSASNRVMMVGLNARELPLIDLSVLARWTIAPRLMGVPGVANVSIWGQRDRQLQVQVDPDKLEASNVTLLQVLETTGNAMWVSSLSFVEASTPGTGGFIETANQRLGIRHVFPISSPEGLAQVPVEGAPSLRLGDVAQVVEDHQPLIGDAVASGPSLLLVVEKSPTANTLEVTEDLEKAIAAMQPGLGGVEIDPAVYRPATFIEMAVGNFSGALALGGLLVLLVLAVGLRDWRAALVSGIAIPVALTAGGLVLYMRGASLNAMVAAGGLMALGVVIDDAVIDIDHALRRLRSGTRRTDDMSRIAVLLDCTVEMRQAAMYALLILGLVLVPVWLIGGLTGALLQPLATTYALALAASIVVALLVTPALSWLLIGRRAAPPRANAHWLGRAQAGYQHLLRSVLMAPQLALLGLTVLAVVGIALIPFTRLSLLPAFREPDLLVHLDGPPGTSRTEMDRIVGRMSGELRALPGVRSVGAHIGRALLSDRVVDVNSSELWVGIDSSASYDATATAIRRVVAGYPGLHHTVQTYLQERSGAVAKADAPLTVRVFGENQATLRRAAEDVQRALNGIPGLAGQHLELPTEQPTLDIEVDLQSAQRYGLKPGDVRRAAATLISGIQAGSLFEDQKVFDVVVWGTPETRNSINRVRDLLLDTPSGEHVRLGDVAQVRVVPSLSVIRHQDVRSYLDIRLDLNDRAPEAVSADIQQRLRQTPLPLEYHAEVVGGASGYAAAPDRLLATAVAAALGILLLLQAATGSWRLAVYGLVVLPSALVGGLIAAFASGGALTLGGLAGLLAVFGVAVRQFLVLIRHYQNLERNEGLVLDPALILRGAGDRFGATLVTLIATLMATAPFALAGNAAGFEVARPLAIVTIAGLITAAALQLIVTPAAYLLLAANPSRTEVLAPVSAAPQTVTGTAAD